MSSAANENAIRDAWDLPRVHQQMLVLKSATPDPLCEVCGRTIYLTKDNPNLGVKNGNIKLVYVGGTRRFGFACGHHMESDKFSLVNVL